MFDYSRTGLLAPANVFGASEWLELPVSALDVIDMIRIADSGRCCFISFLCVCVCCSVDHQPTETHPRS